MKSNERLIAYGIIIAGVIFFFLYDGCRDKKEAKLLNEIAMEAGLRKEADGRYSQLITVVDNGNALMRELKASMDGGFNDIKKYLRKNDERLLAFTTAYLSLRGQRDTTLVFNADPKTGADWQFKLLYPDSANSFIEYDGLAFWQNRQIIGNWTFNRVPLTFILTETAKGNWNARVVGPDYFVVDSIVTRALPAEKIAEARRIALVAGLGAGWDFEKGAPLFSLSAGIRVKKMRFMATGSTRQDVQLQMIRDFGK